MKTQQQSTLSDLARDLGLGTMTVSRALSGRGSVAPKTRERVLAEARRRHYQPNMHASTLARGQREDLIGMLAPSIYSGIPLRRVTHLHNELQRHGFEVPLYSYGALEPPEDEHLALLQNLVRQRPRAIIDLGSHRPPSVQDELQAYVATGGTVVSYLPAPEPPAAWDTLLYDCTDAGYQAARHLIACGHRKIGIFSGGPHTYPLGYAKALSENGLETRAEWQLQGDSNEAGGHGLAEQVLKMPEAPTAWCIKNDVAASSFVQRLTRAGWSIPNDLSVVGFDDTQAAQYCLVPLTTMRYPAQAIAEALAALLLSRLREGYQGPPRYESVCGELVARESCAPPHISGR